MSIKQFTGGTGGAAISLTPNFVAIGPEYCEANGDGLNTGRRLVKQMDINPYSETFQKDRIFVVAEKSDVCPISNEPFYKPTGNKRCKRDDHNRYTGGTEQEERDVNPRSPGFNTSRWVDGPDDLRACPLPELPFLRVLGENAGTINGFKISATISDASGQIFTVTCIYDGTGSPFADLYRDFGNYKLTNLHVEYYAGVAVNKFISRIVMAGVMDQSFLQSDAVNTPSGGSCTIDVAGSWDIVLNENRAIRFVFTDRVAAGQFNATRTAAFTRNDCGPGKTGTAVNFTKTYVSSISQADADSKKANDNNFESEGQAFANDPVNGAVCNVDPVQPEPVYIWGRLVEKNRERTHFGGSIYYYFADYYLETYKGTKDAPPQDLTEPYPSNGQATVAYNRMDKPNDKVFDVGMGNSSSVLVNVPDSGLPRTLVANGNQTVTWWISFYGKAQGEWALIETLNN